MQDVLPESAKMTVEEFLAYTDARPDGERWELIEGVAVLNPSPTQWHQVIVGNLLAALMAQKEKSKAPWLPLLGVETRVPVSPKSLPQPDVYVMEGAATDSPVTDDAMILFEVLSRSDTKADLVWRKRVYASIPNCQHYVTVSARRAEVVRFDRADNWKGEMVQSFGTELTLPAINATIPLGTTYRWTALR